MFSTTPLAARRPFRKLTTPLTREARSSWFIPSGQGFIEESKESPLEARFQQLLQVSIDTAKVQQTFNVDQREVEKNAPRLTELDRESYIEFKSLNDVYEQKLGSKSVIQRMDPKKIKVCAKYIAFMDIAKFLLLDNSEIFAILDKEFGIDTSTNYLAVLKNLYMKPCEFSRSAIEKYVTSFLLALEDNPTFQNPACGGASEKVISKMFVTGIQPAHFRESLDRYSPETVMASKQAITNELPVYQRAVDLGMVPIGKYVEKTPHITLKGKSPSTPYASAAPFQPTWPCRNCDQPGHAWSKCPRKESCLRCPPGTPTHPYWHPTKCVYRRSQPANTSQAKPSAKAFAAVVPTVLAPDPAMLALQAKFDAQEEAFAAYKIANVQKRKFVDSGANVSILSDHTHMDTNSIPLCRRAEDAQGVVTAAGVPMEITGSANFEGVVSKICPESTSSLLSVSQWSTVNDGAMIFDARGAFGVRNDDVVRPLLKFIKEHSLRQSQPILTATISPESLYEITTQPVPVVSVLSHPLTVSLETPAGASLESYGASAAAVTCDTGAWSPSETVLEQHRVAYGAYYHLTADLPRYRDLPDFFMRRGIIHPAT